MAEILFSIVVLVISTSPLIILGIVQYRSKEPVGFWAGKKPPRKAHKIKEECTLSTGCLQFWFIRPNRLCRFGIINDSNFLHKLFRCIDKVFQLHCNFI